jgi:probable DNA metabolism protein
LPDIILDGPADFIGWRTSARILAAKGIPPSDVKWRTAGGTPDLFESPARIPHQNPANDTGFTVPRAFVELAEHAALHRDEGRFDLLYRLLWRLKAERRLMEIVSDTDVVRLSLLARAVRRDIHKMHAFVRFRSVGSGEVEHYVAWYEPDNHIVEAAAPFFMRRFANLHWTILTPERSADWDRSHLAFGPGASIKDAPAEDAVEELWRDYYASIFNPARLNPEAMRAEMPKRFWKNLPEAALIQPLMANAVERARDMVAKAPTLAVIRKGAEIVAKAAPSTEEGLESVRAAAMTCKACPLWQPATQTVFGEGPEKARIMLVGEQPGDVEDIKGRPFVGPAGRLLDRALAEAKIDRAAVYVTNAVKHFKFVPRGKRRIHQKPNSLEIKACDRWLEQELALVNPDMVVALGATAAQALFGHAMPIGKSRGQVIELAGRKALITVHPSYLLRLPDEETRHREYAAFVADLKLARG